MLNTRTKNKEISIPRARIDLNIPLFKLVQGSDMLCVHFIYCTTINILHRIYAATSSSLPSRDCEIATELSDLFGTDNWV